MLTLEGIRHARKRIEPYIVETPLKPPLFTEQDRATRLFKCEHIQMTGAFKVRGALNKVLKLKAEIRHVVAASTGNHGVAVSYAAQRTQRQATIFMPRNTDRQRVERIERLGSMVRLVGDDCVTAEQTARKFASDEELVYLSPYNDLDIIEGQGTLGLELFEQAPDLSHVVISVGGGGLIAGAATALKCLNPSIAVIGASPLHSNVMSKSVQTGRLHSWSGLDTLSKSTAGGLEEPSVTLPLCRRLVDQWVDVTEEEIQLAMDRLLGDELMYVEGAAALADAAASRLLATLSPSARVAIVLCGANR